MPASRAFAAVPATPLPQLELSGPKLRQALSALVAGAEGHGGVERFVQALQVKSRLFRELLGAGRARQVENGALKALCALVATARRRIGPYLEPPGFESLRRSIVALLEGAENTGSTDARVAAFCAAFPQDRGHRWVRDLAAEILHNVDPERYPLMHRWVWDHRANTGVLREIWHAQDVDHLLIVVPDTYDTFLVLRQELATFLAGEGIYRDVPFYADLLTAQVYATYIGEQGGSYLRTDFATPEDSMVHVQRMLGLDGVDARGRTRLKLAEGKVLAIDDPLLPH